MCCVIRGLYVQLFMIRISAVRMKVVTFGGGMDEIWTKAADFGGGIEKNCISLPSHLECIHIVV